MNLIVLYVSMCLASSLALVYIDLRESRKEASGLADFLLNFSVVVPVSAFAIFSIPYSLLALALGMSMEISAVLIARRLRS